MLTMLVAYDVSNEVVATLGHCVQYDEQGNPLGLVDFEAHEVAGESLTDIWTVQDAAGSGTWPEWLGGAAHDFKVELRPGPKGGTPSIRALVHKISGHRRERANIEAEISRRSEAARNELGEVAPVDLRDLLGGPQRPKRLDADGRDAPPQTPVPRPRLPLVGGPGMAAGRP
jgi:hypothetical protein